jgi:hypothetical protein
MSSTLSVLVEDGEKQFPLLVTLTKVIIGDSRIILDEIHPIRLSLLDPNDLGEIIGTLYRSNSDQSIFYGYYYRWGDVQKIITGPNIWKHLEKMPPGTSLLRLVIENPALSTSADAAIELFNYIKNGGA